jgi:predicted transcriptional regulator
MKKNHPAFDPSELNDLILTPAVGTGVGSHLIGQAPHKTIEASSYKTTVVINNEPTMAMMWVTEAGDLIPASRVKPIRLLQDILNAAEQAVYEALWNHVEAIPQEHSRLVQAGYHPLMKNTHLSKKTIQRVIDRLIAKDFIAVEQPADIYERRSTVYRVFSFSGILTRLEARGRLHAARIGPGVVYARPFRQDFPHN